MKWKRYERAVWTRQMTNPYKTAVGKTERKRPKDLGVNRIIPSWKRDVRVGLDPSGSGKGPVVVMVGVVNTVTSLQFL
jgi:hypothetical protein